MSGAQWPERALAAATVTILFIAILVAWFR
jgi:hypothetical protein